MAGLDTVQVFMDLERLGRTVPMGALHRQQSGAGEIFSFEYDRTWLERTEVFAFDPDLALAAGHQYPAPDRTNFGIFLDSSPDRWGRVLMQRRENTRARREKTQATRSRRVGLSPGRSRRNSLGSIALSRVTRPAFHRLGHRLGGASPDLPARATGSEFAV